MKNKFTLLIAFLAVYMASFSQIRQFRSNLYIVDPNGNPVLMDGTLSLYNDDYSNEVDGQDARKMINPGENIGILRDDKILIVERRQDIAGSDTIFFKLWNTRIITYRLELTSKYFDESGNTAVLYDKFLNTETELSFLENNHYDFSVTSDADSKRNDRFMVVFNQEPEPEITPEPVPFEFVTFFAKTDGNRVSVSWKTVNESNLENFVVERSADSVNFGSCGIPVSAHNGSENNYIINDVNPLSGDSYYRIKGVDMDGKTTLSSVQKVSLQQQAQAVSEVAIYPNPATSSNIQLRINSPQGGNYRISIVNNTGVVLHTYTRPLSSGQNHVKLPPVQNIIPGIYGVEISGPDGYRKSLRILITR